MSCKDVKEYREEYEKLENEIKAICTDRACTSESILKALDAKGIKLDETIMMSMIGQILGMMAFEKGSYEVGDAVIYKKGLIFKSEGIGNLILKVRYKKFYLYNPLRNVDEVFRNRIYDKLEFEILDKNTVSCSEDLENALYVLNIEKKDWGSYVFVVPDNNVYCMKYDTSYHKAFRAYKGRLIARVPKKITY